MLYSEFLKNIIISSDTFDFEYMSRLFMLDFVNVNGATLINDDLNHQIINDFSEKDLLSIYNQEQSYNEIFFSSAHINETNPETITLNEMVIITLLLISIYKKRIQKKFTDRKVEIIAVIEEEFGLSVNMRIHTIYEKNQLTQIDTSNHINDQFKTHIIAEVIEPDKL